VTNRGKALGRCVEYVLVSVALPQMEADALTSRIGGQCGFRSLQTMRDPRYVYPEAEQLGARLRQDPWRADPIPLANSAATTSDRSVPISRQRYSSIR
jgi:hypothetical protein